MFSHEVWFFREGFSWDCLLWNTFGEVKYFLRNNYNLIYRLSLNIFPNLAPLERVSFNMLDNSFKRNYTAIRCVALKQKL